MNYGGTVLDKKLFFTAISRVTMGAVLVGLLIFVPAGTAEFRNGWLLMAILFIPMFIAGMYMLFRRPDLLRKRLNVREKEMEQREVIAMSGIMFIASFVVAGLNYRFGWISMPFWSVAAAAVVFLAGYAMYGEVIRENEYLSRTIEVQEGQKVVDTGLYGVIRHPMYSATLLMFLAMPLVLGSPLSFLISLLYIPIIAKRIKNEEKVLVEGLDGYPEYLERVKYRLLPYIW